MSSTKEQDVVPYQNEPLQSSDAGVAGARFAAGDARRRAPMTTQAYLGPEGTPLALTGDAEAPFVKIIFDVPAILPVSSIPTDAEDPGTGVVIVAQTSGSLHDGWVTDSQDPNTASARWIQLFDDNAAPSSGDVPSYAPVSMCIGGTTPIDFVTAPFGFTRGLVIAISSTANTYTPITPANDYSLTVRVQPRSL